MAAELQPLFVETLSELLAPIAPYLSDESVSEVMINGRDQIYIERAGRIERVKAQFDSDESLEAAARNIAQFSGKRLTHDEQSIEARLPDGSRVHIVQAPAARLGLCMAIRKFSKQKLRLADLVSRGALTEEAAEYLSFAVELKKNIIVSGGTGSGKTTLLNCLSGMIPAHERIIVIEDSSELQLQQEHVVPFEAKSPDRFGNGGISIRDLFRASLRMRPDRIIVGECRGGEALDMIQAMSSGHGGSMSTCHADRPRDALSRLETMSLMGGVDLPLSALRSQIGAAIELIVQVTRSSDGRRGVVEIAEMRPLDDQGRYQMTTIFEYRVPTGAASGALVWSGERPGFVDLVRRVHAQAAKTGPSRRLWD